MSLASKRKGLSKTLRFEVFKRDSFTCQYCGRKAPDVVLEADHIKPVKCDGDNNILNLVTACRDCNAGKGAKELTDHQTLNKQRQQLEELNERRKQLEMMVEWREGLLAIDDAKAEKISGAFTEKSGFDLTEESKYSIRKWLRRYPFEELFEATHAALDQYLVLAPGSDECTLESANKAFDYIPKVCYGQIESRKNPHIKDLLYIRGILRNRLNYLNERCCLELLKDAHAAGIPTDELRDLSKSVRSWTHFRDELSLWIDQAMDDEEGEGDHRGQD